MYYNTLEKGAKTHIENAKYINLQKNVYKITSLIYVYTNNNISLAASRKVLAFTTIFILICLFVSRRCKSLQYLPHPECDPALHGGAVHRRQRILQVTPQHHPQLGHPLRLRRYEGKGREEEAGKGE